MKHVDFEKSNLKIGEDQEQYNTLYVHSSGDEHGTVTAKWEFSDEDKEKIANGEGLYLQVMTFGGPFLPVLLQVGEPELPEAPKQEE